MIQAAASRGRGPSLSLSPPGKGEKEPKPADTIILGRRRGDVLPPGFT